MRTVFAWFRFSDGFSGRRDFEERAQRSRSGSPCPATFRGNGPPDASEGRPAGPPFSRLLPRTPTLHLLFAWFRVSDGSRRPGAPGWPGIFRLAGPYVSRFPGISTIFLRHRVTFLVGFPGKSIFLVFRFLAGAGRARTAIHFFARKFSGPVRARDGSRADPAISVGTAKKRFGPGQKCNFGWPRGPVV